MMAAVRIRFFTVDTLRRGRNGRKIIAGFQNFLGENARLRDVSTLGSLFSLGQRSKANIFLLDQ